jgi:PAS domain S-box-containing protein
MPPPSESRRNGIFSPGNALPSRKNFLHTRFFSIGIRARILALVLLALIPALLLISQLARSHRDEINRNVNAMTLRLARIVATGLDRDIQSARGFLAALAHSPGRSARPGTDCPDLIRSLDIGSVVYAAVGLADASGAILCQTPAAPRPRLDSCDWFAGARDKAAFTVGYDLEGIVHGKATMDFALPSPGPDGRTAAVFYCATDLEWLNRMAERLQLPAGATLAVSDREGRTLVRYPHPERYVGKKYPDSPMSRLLLDQREGLIEAPGLDGVVRLYAFSHFGQEGLAVRIGIPRAQAYAQGDQAMRASLIALGAVGAMALALAWLAGHFMVVRQVRRLVGATRALAAGDLGARAGMEYSGSEFGQLAQAFDEMAESLQWRMAQLRESETERSHSQDRFSALADLAPDAILGVDEDFSLFFCNLGAEHLFGRNRGELEGHRLDALLERDGVKDGDGGGQQYRELVGALRDPGRQRVQATLVRGDGTPFRAEMTVARSRRHGRINYALMVRERET